MPLGPATADELERLAALIAEWAAGERAAPVVVDIEHDPDLSRWYVRLRGEEKEVTTIWLTLRERTLHYEAYFMPAPEENAEQLYEYLLRVNARLFGVRFAIGIEDAIFLVGQMPLSAIDSDELDRVVGSVYAYAEQHFRPAMSIGFASRFKPRPGSADRRP